MDMRHETIAAICTPSGRGGIGIIRLSGDKSFDILKSISQTNYQIESFLSLKNRKLIYANIVNEKKEKIDEVLVALMPANKSYTKEPTVEINCHGGRAVLTAVLKLLLKEGARLANPGEFTRRAVENNRIDLVQAEAINELINARTEKSLRIALKQMEGGLTTRCKVLREKIISILTEIQAQVDFEVDDKFLKTGQWQDSIKEIKNMLEAMLKSSKIRKFTEYGASVVLAGAPNAGKSSLFNAILNVERSIVCNEPGTTRDHISEVIEIDGIEIKITDTAGIRETDSKVEEISIERTRQQIESADFVLYILDQSIELKEEARREIRKTLSKKGILILNKSDAERHLSVDTFILNEAIEYVSVSATRGDGIDTLLDKISEWLSENVNDVENVLVATMRQTKLLEKACEHIQASENILAGSGHIDMMVYEMEQSIDNLVEILGEIRAEDIYDQIFSKFCIGK